MLFAKRSYPEIQAWKIPLYALALAVLGVYGTKVMFWMENGFYAGTSFFGAVLFTPFAMALVAYSMRIRWTYGLDVCGPAECIMLAMMKAHCMYVGCCNGKIIWSNFAGATIRFPSQLAELVNALVLTGVLLGAIRRGKWKGKVYALYLILYGASRFLLNLLRETDTFLLGLPAGNFWSIVSILAGLTWLLIVREGRGVGNEKNA